MSIKSVHGVWLPEFEKHMINFAFGPGWTYQGAKLRKAIEFCPRRKVAIDVGAHCGLWSRNLVQLFDRVEAFEPLPLHRECYGKNVQGDYALHPCALGKEPQRVSITTCEGSSGSSYIDGAGDIEVRTLDSFGLDPDFIKIDTEGYELFVLMGAEETLKKSKPAIIVEQKGGAERYGAKNMDAVEYLKGLGYVLHGSMCGDYILSHPGQRAS